jgi:hypothetical protein
VETAPASLSASITIKPGPKTMRNVSACAAHLFLTWMGCSGAVATGFSRVVRRHSVVTSLGHTSNQRGASSQTTSKVLAVEENRRARIADAIESELADPQERKGCGAHHRTIQELFRAPLRFARVPPREEGSADSVSICCSRNRLLPPSDNMGLLSFGIRGETNPVTRRQSIPAGVSL